jgi:hypothetical protein
MLKLFVVIISTCSAYSAYKLGYSDSLEGPMYFTFTVFLSFFGEWIFLEDINEQIPISEEYEVEEDYEDGEELSTSKPQSSLEISKEIQQFKKSNPSTPPNPFF